MSPSPDTPVFKRPLRDYQEVFYLIEILGVGEMEAERSPSLKHKVLSSRLQTRPDRLRF
jgi:hypothetical protein